MAPPAAPMLTAPTVSLKTLKLKLPPLTATAPVSSRLLEAPKASVPAVMTVPPANELAPDSVVVPAPLCVSAAAAPPSLAETVAAAVLLKV